MRGLVVLVGVGLCLVVYVANAAAQHPVVPPIGSGSATKSPPPASGAEAEKAAAKWLESLPKKGLVLVEKVEKAADGGFAGRKVIGRKSTMFVYRKPGWYMSLGFSDAIEADTPLATVRQRFKYVALDRLPTPGLDVPGWEIRPRTPVSSFQEGVEIVGCGNGRIQLRVKTKFFALSGRNPNVLVPADAPMPPGTFFQIRKPFPLDLTIDAPFAMGK
ncbi:MAG: hypothetical protein HQ567_23980 [Candidatus Nealsonbacteria bacterium]|nr:hypothetical protein [Candidatus Nealsonbacteria bacterium]